ncbi:MAG TPA: MBL fold metallo-hydrolase [Thermoanaerobaculia bacterium]|jgi:ribonuclease Z|nr:MBL fold metallo-hydrolase [Thermoanaerobaculia bacterium]
MDTDFVTIPTEHFTIEGRSRAGHETWFRVRELGVALDIGRCPDPLIGMPHIFITHAHLDHALGIPFYAGQRHLQRIEGGRVYVPAEAADDFRTLMSLHEKLEETDYDIEIIGMAQGEAMRIGRRHIVRAHDATHRVAARAYEVLEIRHHLKKELEGTDAVELARLRHEGVTVSEDFEHSMLFYTGDTDRGILETNERLFQSEVLMIECSFVADGHQDRAAQYRHIHFDDIAEFADRFDNRMIVLTHFSRRYAREEIRDVLRRRCPAVLRDRLRLALPAPFTTLE